MVNGLLLYKCHACGKQFLEAERRNSQAIFTEYLEDKQTYEQLARKYGCSTKTTQRCLDKVCPSRSNEFSPLTNIVMDTTYFGRKFGVMVFKNSMDGMVLLKKYVKSETAEGYVSGMAEIATRGLSVHDLLHPQALEKRLQKPAQQPAAPIPVRALEEAWHTQHTTNTLDGQFSDLKNKLRNHNGLSVGRKKKLIDGYFHA
ncbi:MAG: hypothetical protein IJ057_04050 [Bacteroidales bacterium]|nr:hypothetical protein [Bacteroidales bacterium]